MLITSAKPLKNCESALSVVLFDLNMYNDYEINLETKTQIKNSK